MPRPMQKTETKISVKLPMKKQLTMPKRQNETWCRLAVGESVITF